MIYLITYGLPDIPATDPLWQSITSTRGHGLEDMDGAVVRYWIPYCRTDTYRTPSSVHLWSSIVDPDTKAPHSSTDPRVIQGINSRPPIQT
ncbi:hypothetical protein DPMN_001070 [Dreissena polymorpha]|uniref:Uncharacterized protein n=1 Tax=Dreissena polymorpha TaxID=45954 RepID=A0A9D4MKA8_DREPO|nr:hypothetical protein DPMN_001070 [Dreissena polymorpha]